MNDVETSHPNAVELQPILEVAARAARQAGEILQSWASRFTVSEKGPSDLVTEADFASQKAIVETIDAHYPTHDLLGEEGLSKQRSDTGYRWIIDPLDGTSNYVHGFPYYCVSIGVEFAGKPAIGVIYDPNRDELFTAAAGGGTKRNGQPVRPTETTRLDDAFLVASLPRRAQADDLAMRRFVRAVPRAESVQRTGSAALNLAYIACGRIDAFWSSSLNPWDLAAGVILVTEAGGKVTSFTGDAFEMERPEILASNGTVLHDAVSGMLMEAAAASAD